jgi:DNA invertase Pin-like site-specific DNA recombinase
MNPKCNKKMLKNTELGITTYFYSLDCKLKKNLRKEIMNACDIGYSTFYKYINNPSETPKLVREKISQILDIKEEKLYV